MQATELKRLQNALGIAQSELRKVQEQYAECNKYCAFLDSITPHEFFQEQAARYETEWQVRVQGIIESVNYNHTRQVQEQCADCNILLRVRGHHHTPGFLLGAVSAI